MVRQFKNPAAFGVTCDLGVRPVPTVLSTIFSFILEFTFAEKNHFVESCLNKLQIKYLKRYMNKMLHQRFEMVFFHLP